LEWKVTDKLNLVGGAAFEHFNATPKSTDTESPVDEKNALSGIMLGSRSLYKPEGLMAPLYLLKYSNAGAFIQFSYSPVGKLSFTIGSRFDHNSRYGSTWNPRAGIVYSPDEKTVIKALYGSAFIAPSPLDAYEIYGSFYTSDSGKTYKSYFWHLPNPKLKPIREKMAELSASRILNANLNISSSFYFAHISNLYANAPDAEHDNLYGGKFMGYDVDYIEVAVNQGSQVCYGGNIRMNYEYKAGRTRINNYVGVSYVDGMMEDNKKETTLAYDLNYISHWMVRGGFDVHHGRFSLSPRVIWMGEQHLAGVADTTGDRIRRQHIAGYTLVNLAVRCELSDRLSIFGNVRNLLDQKYKNVGWDMNINKPSTELFHGANQDPIRFSGGVSMSF
jgi:outer membrane receptor for ferrienterochelin and colicin